MLLLIRPKKRVVAIRRKPIISATKRIGAFAKQVFMGLFGIAISLGLVFKDTSEHQKYRVDHKVLITILHHVTAVAESVIILIAVLGFLFARNREEE